MWYWLIEMRSLIIFNLKFIHKTSSYGWLCVILLAIRVLVGHIWGIGKLWLLDYNLNLILVIEMKIMRSIRVWQLFGKNEYGDYYQHAERRWWSVILPSLGKLLITVLIWWHWGFEVTTVAGIIKPVRSGSQEHYKYFINI